MTEWAQKNTFYIRCYLYSYIVTSASSGGAISSTNSAYSFFIDRTVFNNCSAKNRGGAFMISCKAFFFQRSCCSFCYCPVKMDGGWGHCGSAIVSTNGTVERSVVFRCAYQSGLGGHVSFDLEKGVQNFDNFNASSCLSNGDVYAYGATKVSGSYCTLFDQDSGGFTLRNVAKQNVTLSHFVFIKNPDIGFKIDPRDYNNHNTLIEDSIFINNSIDMSGSSITINRCSTSKPTFSKVTDGEDCNANANIIHSTNEKFISDQCGIITIDWRADPSDIKKHQSFTLLIISLMIFSY